MNKVAIVADSSVCLPEELIREYEILVVPLELHLGGKSYKDRIDIKTPDELFQLMKELDEFPTTSTPSPGEFAEVYRQLSQKTDNILTVTMSSVLSGTIGSARQAAEMIKNEIPDINIEVFDSRLSVGAEGLIVLAAARAAASGQDMEAVIKVAEDIKSRVTMLDIFDNLSNLAKSGRISKVAAMAGNMLSMKPITEMPISLGRAMVIARPRTKKKAIQVLLELVKQKAGANSSLHIIVEHTSSPGEAERLKEIVLDQFDCAEVLLCEYSPLSSAICGPGLVGLAFY